MATIQVIQGFQKIKDSYTIINTNDQAINNQLGAHISGVADRHLTTAINVSTGYTLQNDLDAKTARVNAHVAGSAEKHKALDVTFTPITNISATEVQSAIAQVNTRVGNIIAQSGTSDTEVVDARLSATYGANATLKSRVDNTDAKLKVVEDAINTPAQQSLNLTELSQIQSVTDSYNGIAETEVGGASLSQVIVDGQNKPNGTVRSFTALNGITYFTLPDKAFVLGTGVSVNVTNNTGVNANIMAIPITSTPYSTYTADQMNALVNTYWEGLRSTQSVELGSRGRNIIPFFDRWTIHPNAGFDNDKLTLVATSSNQNSEFFIKVKPNTTYTLTPRIITASDNARLNLREFNSTGTSIITRTGTNQATLSFTTGANVNMIYIRVFGQVAGTYQFNPPMLNEGSTALPYEKGSFSEVKITYTDPTKFDGALLPNGVRNSTAYKDGKWSAVKRVQRLSVASGVVINTTNLVGASTTSQYYLVQSDGVTSIGLVNGTYTTTATATVYYGLATPLTINESQFAENGITVDGVLTSNDDFTEFVVQDYDLFAPTNVTYATNLAKSVENLKESVQGLRALVNNQNLINLEFDARITLLE